MTSTAPWRDLLARTNHSAQQWLAQWWKLLHLGAVLLLLALLPSSYKRADRLVLARHVYDNTAPIMTSFTLLCALISLVLTRIVTATALSYGLSQYSLQVVIRVLVLELIPLTAAMFVALRCSIPDGAELAELKACGDLDKLRQQGIDPIHREVLPRCLPAGNLTSPYHCRSLLLRQLQFAVCQCAPLPWWAVWPVCCCLRCHLNWV